MVGCPSCGEQNPAGARFCDACGAALTPSPAREVRKTVTVFFADVTGSTALGEQLDPEALRHGTFEYGSAAIARLRRLESGPSPSSSTTPPGRSAATRAPAPHARRLLQHDRTRDGDYRAMQPRQVYRSQQYGTAVYRAELARASEGTGLRHPGREERHAGDQGILARVLSKPTACGAGRFVSTSRQVGTGAPPPRSLPTAHGRPRLPSGRTRSRQQHKQSPRHSEQPEKVVRAARERGAIRSTMLPARRSRGDVRSRQELRARSRRRPPRSDEGRAQARVRQCFL